MKKIILLIVLSLFIFTGTAFAKSAKGNIGQCVSECVKVFNKSTKDKGANPDKVGKFIQTECADWCKDEYVAGEGFFWADGVCNEKYAKNDPDCEDVKPLKDLGEPCAGDFECQSDNCYYDFFLPYPVCSAPE